MVGTLGGVPVWSRIRAAELVGLPNPRATLGMDGILTLAYSVGAFEARVWRNVSTSSCQVSVVVATRVISENRR